jgi:protein TonB
MLDRNRPSEPDIGGSIPEELQALDRELSAIRIEERPSFGPELERELARAWQARGGGRWGARTPGVRLLLAACFGGLMVVGVSVPPARAAVVRLVRTVLEEALPSVFTPTPEPEPSPVRFQEPAPEDFEEAEPAPDVSSPAEVSRDEAVGQPIPIPEYTYPELLDPEEAEAVVASHYPLGLQRAGIGGSVKVMVWVTPEGTAESINGRQYSAYRSLDYAALLAARELRFRPATRDGTPVGTWVEFFIHFIPNDSAGAVELQPLSPGGIGGR